MEKLSVLLNTADNIVDDGKRREKEYDIVHEYCRAYGYQLNVSDIAIIIERELEDNYITWKQAYIEELWAEFGDIPMDPETECIEAEWNGFSAGTQREEILSWFEENFNVSVAEDLMRL